VLVSSETVQCYCFGFSANGSSRIARVKGCSMQSRVTYSKSEFVANYPTSEFRDDANESSFTISDRRLQARSVSSRYLTMLDSTLVANYCAGADRHFLASWASGGLARLVMILVWPRRLSHQYYYTGVKQLLLEMQKIRCTFVLV